MTNSRQRIIDHGEVFTPPGLVNDMLDLVAGECERVESRFLEPACGDGNFLAEVLRRKLATVDQKRSGNSDAWRRDAVLAVSSLYGIDLLPDNVAACRDRLLGVVRDRYADRFRESFPKAASHAVAYILSKNIVHGDALTLRTSDGQPIVFAEWSPLPKGRLKRRDFKFDHLLGHAEYNDPAQSPLFSDAGDEVNAPKPVADYSACHYTEVANVGITSAEVENART